MKGLILKMNALAKTNRLELSMATSMLAVTADRIFNKGIAADNALISDKGYSKGYLKTRIKKGYPSSSKVILQAERQMANDFSVINNNDSVGLGFKNQTNADKSGWVEETYKKDIFKHTDKELKLVDKLLEKEIKNILR